MAKIGLKNGIIFVDGALNAIPIREGKGIHIVLEKPDALGKLAPLIGSEVFYIQSNEDGSVNDGNDFNFCGEPFHTRHIPEMTGVDFRESAGHVESF